MPHVLVQALPAVHAVVVHVVVVLHIVPVLASLFLDELDRRLNLITTAI